MDGEDSKGRDEMKQEPIAWMRTSPSKEITQNECVKDMWVKNDIEPIPLYTAPKQLSDEEIENKVKTIPHKNGTDYAVGFYEGAKWAVEEILKKATEYTRREK